MKLRYRNPFSFWSRRLFSVKEGERAEAYFLEAANRLGYVFVRETNPRLAYTIRAGSFWENSQRLQDFIVTEKVGDMVVVIPLELTIMDDPSYPRLTHKLTLAREGRIALLWPGEGLTSSRFVELLKRAAAGDEASLQDIRRALDLSFEQYFAANGKIF